jgi:hypothetical protein
MSDVVVRAERPPLALVDKLAAPLRVAIEPTWGMFNPKAAYARNEVRGELLPVAMVLKGMRQELLHALAPLSDIGPEGLNRALRAAREVNESFPQKDTTGAAWARGVAARLAECPPDLLSRVVERLLNSHDYRPSLAEVKRGVAEAVAGRKLTLMRVEAALRWHEVHAEHLRLQPMQVSPPMPRMPGSEGVASAVDSFVGMRTAANDA